MYKKLLLILGLAQVSIGQASNNNIVPVVAGAAVTTALVIYIAMRESNDVKVERFYKLQQAYQSTIERHMLSINTQADLISFAKQSWKVKEELHLIHSLVEKSYEELNARYNTWFKPWNWSDTMKISWNQSACLYNKVCFLLDIFKWSRFLEKDVNLLTDQELVKIARTVSASNSVYPIVTCVEMLEQAVARCKWQYSNIGCSFLFIDTLQQIAAALYATEQYANDKKEYEKHLLELRRVKAEEDKARSERDKAWAQQQQAWAQRDQADAQHRQAEAMEQANRRR